MDAPALEIPEGKRGYGCVGSYAKPHTALKTVSNPRAIATAAFAGGEYGVIGYNPLFYQGLDPRDPRYAYDLLQSENGSFPNG